MSSKNIPDEILHCFNEIGLNPEESIVFYTLIKQGKNGATVRILNMALPSIERTTLYPILQRLINKKFVIVERDSKTLKKAKNFVAINPSNLFSMIKTNKQEELERLEHLRSIFTEKMQKKYISLIKYDIDDIDPIIQPYISLLIENNWSVISQLVKKDSEIFGYDFYRININPPNNLVSQKWNNGFQAYVFDAIINSKMVFKTNSMLDQEKLEIKYALSQIQRFVRERFFHKFDKVQIKFIEGKKNLLGKAFFSYVFKIKPENALSFNEIFHSIIFSIDNKIFFIWASIERILLEILRSILNGKKMDFN